MVCKKSFFVIVIVCKHFMVREYNRVKCDDEFKHLSQEIKQDVALRSEKFAKENEVQKNWNELFKNNVILFSEKNKLP